MKKILIIEDDPIVGHIYRSRLEKEGFQVEVAADGQTGYYRLYDLKPDVLLLDLMLPKINGIDLLKKIRAVREFQNLPVLVFTNAYVAHMIHEAFASGATAVYNKSSVTPRQIIDVVNSIFNGTFAPQPQATNAPVIAAPAKPATPAPAAAPISAPNATATASAPALMAKTDDAAFQADLQRTFLNGSGTAVNEMRKVLQELSKATDETARATHVENLYRKARTYSTNAGLAGIGATAKLAAAVEALVKELLEKPKTVTPSALRTLAAALDCFGELAQPHVPHDLADAVPIQILVVDDDMLSRRAIVYALEKAFLTPVSVEHPDEALQKTARTRFDLMFLDVHLPGTDGFALCDKLRQNGPNRTTPIVFVTGTADFQARAQSTLKGASDLIAKPFMFIELTVKALTFALRSRAEQMRRATTPSSTAAPITEKSPAEVII
jgi:CheY-like chemotaxis protein